ncbi:MAG: S8 family peptidase [Clostridium sp.]
MKKNMYRQFTIEEKDFLGNYKDSKDMIGFIVEYNKNQNLDDIEALYKTSVIKIDDNYAIVYTPFNKILDIEKYITGLYGVMNPTIYTLNDLTPIEATNAPALLVNPYLNLNGKGTLIGIVDTGIDYTNQEFIKEDGTTRIISIWDQGVEPVDVVNGLELGVEYKMEKINEALRLKKDGGDPYTIVPVKDEIGHGTMVAGISAGRGINPGLKGVAPQADLVIVKLQQISEPIKKIAAISKLDVPAYEEIDVVVGVRYLSKIAKDLKRPITIIIPLGSNNGGHDGTSVLEDQIDTTSKLIGSVCVTGVGNEGDTDTHTEGKFDKSGDIKVIELKVGKNQKDLNFSIWCQKPDRVLISVVSPSGEVVNKLQPKMDKYESYKFIYEGTKMYVKYILPDSINGDEIINLRFNGLREGIWQIRVHGEYVVDGRYWSWLPQRKLLDDETKFLNPSQYTTLMLPCTSEQVIATAYYNQSNNATVIESGRGYSRDNSITPSISTGGINAPIIRPGGQIGVSSGSSVATAVLGGVCSLLLQWGIVDGNLPKMYAVAIKSYIIRGARKRSGDIYPNKEWGYGMLDIEGVFGAIRGDNLNRSNYEKDDKYNEYKVGGLFVRVSNE